jgi:hypothetical protein
VTTTWVVPTARAIGWSPLAGVAVSLLAVTAVAAYAGSWPVAVLGIAAAALSAALVAGLRDPAAALLSAVPTSPGVRRARRQALLVPAGLALWLAYVAAGRHWEPGVGWSLGTLAALATTGLAVAVWAPARAAVEAGVAAPLLWYAATPAGGSLEGEYAEVLLAWQHHPWIVTVAAVAALLLGRNR